MNGVTTLRFNLKDELLCCFCHREEGRFIIATRCGLEIYAEENQRLRKLEMKDQRVGSVISHDALFVKAQVLKKSRSAYYIQEVTADSDGSIRGYSCSTGKLEWTIQPGVQFGELNGHTSDVVQIVKGPSLSVGSSPVIISCGLDGLAFAWNIDVRNKIQVYDRFPTEPKKRVPATAVVYMDNLNICGSNVSKGVAVGYADGMICIYDFNQGTLLLELNKDMTSGYVESNAIVDQNKLRSVPRWKNSVRGLFWSNVYQCIFAAIGDDGVFGYDPACSTPLKPIAHNPMNCAYLKPLGPIPELGVGEEGVAAFVASDGRVMLMRPTYSAAKASGHFIPVCTAFSMYELPPTSTFIMDVGKPAGRCIVLGCQKSIQFISFNSMSSLLIHGHSEIVRETYGANVHKMNFELESETSEKARYLSLIPEPLPNEIRYKLAEKERQIGLNTEGSNEELEKILETFKDIKTGKVKKVKKTRQIEVPLEENDEGYDPEDLTKTKTIEEEYEEVVPIDFEEEGKEEEKENEEDENDPLNEILDMKYFKKLLKVITPEGVCPSEVINTSISKIADSLELLKQVSILFKMKIPKIDVESMGNLSDEQMRALDNASQVMNTAYPTVGIETETGVSTAESKQSMKVQEIPKSQVMAQPTTPIVGGTAVVTGENMPLTMQGFSAISANELLQNQIGMQGAQNGTGLDDSSLPPYLRAQKANPYAGAYGSAVPTVNGSMPQVSPFQAKKTAYGADAYASVNYDRPVNAFQQLQQQRLQQAQQLPFQPHVVEQTYDPALLTSFNAFDILARLVARSIALYLKRAAILDTRLLVTFGGREAKDLATSLGSADEDVAIVKAKFERQRKTIEARQNDEIENIKAMFADFKTRFKNNVTKEKKSVAARFEILRREYNDRRCYVAKKSADILLKTMLQFFPRYTVIGTRWVIVPSVPKSYPAFQAYDMLRNKMSMVHPIILNSQSFNKEVFSVSNVKGVIRPCGIATSEDAWHRSYVITPLPPENTLKVLMDNMPRALHPREIAHLIFPLVCTLARLQALPGESRCIVHRDIRPSTVFLTDNKEMTFDEYIHSPFPQYDPNAETFINGNIPSKRWPIPKVPVPSIFHLGAVRDCVMDEPYELNSIFCAPEVILGGICECSDTWSIGMIVLKLLLPQLGGGTVTRMTRIAMPAGLLQPVVGGQCTCISAVSGYLNDVARLSGIYDKLNLPLIDDMISVCHIPPYGANLLKTCLPIQQTSMQVNVNPNVGINMNTYGGINNFIQNNAAPDMGDALEQLLPQCDAGTLQFLSECLKFNPRERPSPIKLAHHPWFREHGLLVM